jgi:hypothetical protein
MLRNLQASSAVRAPLLGRNPDGFCNRAKMRSFRGHRAGAGRFDHVSVWDGTFCINALCGLYDRVPVAPGFAGLPVQRLSPESEALSIRYDTFGRSLNGRGWAVRATNGRVDVVWRGGEIRPASLRLVTGACG